MIFNINVFVASGTKGTGADIERWWSIMGQSLDLLNGNRLSINS